MTQISLAEAEAVIAGAFERGAVEGCAPLTVVVLDPGGHVVALARADGSSTLRPAIAIGKAASALGLGMSSRKVGEMAADRPTFFAALGAIAPHGLIPAAGGLIINGEDGSPIGAVGVTGDVSDNDEICALAGIARAGLHTN